MISAAARKRRMNASPWGNLPLRSSADAVVSSRPAAAVAAPAATNPLPRNERRFVRPYVLLRIEFIDLLLYGQSSQEFIVMFLAVCLFKFRLLWRRLLVRVS